MGAYLVEVDVHTLELKIGRAVVPEDVLNKTNRENGPSHLCRVNLHAGAIEAMLARDVLPVE